jgi:hypothetical protein
MSELLYVFAAAVVVCCELLLRRVGCGFVIQPRSLTHVFLYFFCLLRNEDRRVFSDILGAIGNTPLVRINKVAKQLDCEVCMSLDLACSQSLSLSLSCNYT